MGGCRTRDDDPTIGLVWRPSLWRKPMLQWNRRLAVLLLVLVLVAAVAGFFSGNFEYRNLHW
jgi:hypothetical protein